MISWKNSPATLGLSSSCILQLLSALAEPPPTLDPRLKAEERLAIILGTEGTGLKSETITRASYTAKIPMSHNVDSLNVAAAGAVAFFALCDYQD